MKPFQTMGRYCQHLLNESCEAHEGSRTLSVVVEICKLVAPLCQNTQRILKKSNDDQETANSWKVPIEAIVSSIVARIAHSCCDSALQALPTAQKTYGLIGSDNVSKKSSILFVCSLS